MLDHPLLLDIFSLGTPQLRTGLVFLFFFKVSFEKHPSVGPSFHVDSANSARRALLFQIPIWEKVGSSLLVKLGLEFVARGSGQSLPAF